ncbi:MAG: carboxypeptidase-like regulatory domain-containing protein [Bradymonadia bacterium]
MIAKLTLGLLSLLLCWGCIEDRRQRDPEEFFAADSGPGDASVFERDASDTPDSRVVVDAGPVVDGQVLGDATASDGGRIEDGSFAVDGDVADEGAGGDAGGLADAHIQDADIQDASLEDGGVDASGPDGELPDDGLVDALVPDVEVPDGELPDAELPDEGVVDMGAPDGDTPPAMGLIIGRASAIDNESPVTVTAGERTIRLDIGGFFQIGALPPGPVQVVVSAPGHQTERVEVIVPEVGEVAIEAPIVLYRGRRISSRQAERLLISPDEVTVAWIEGESVWASAIDAPEDRLLLPDGYEVYLGYTPDNGAVTVRVRGDQGEAGDIWSLPVDGSPATRVFQRAQPWIRWIDDRALAMVDTVDALSSLVSNNLQGDDRVLLGVGVPWLQVSQMIDGRVSWTQQREDGAFDVIQADTLGRDAQVVSFEEGPADGAFLTTTSGRRGLLWTSPDGALWRWTGDSPPEDIAQQVLVSPRPTGLGVFQALYWQQGDPMEGAESGDYLFYDGEASRLLGAGLRPGSVRSLGRALYGVGAVSDLYFGDLDGIQMAPIIEGAVDEMVVAGGGITALIEGEVWTHRPENAQPVNVGPLIGGQLRRAPSGLTAFDADTGTLWWLPDPGGEGEITALVEGAPAAVRLSPIGELAVITRSADGLVKIPLPPGRAEAIPFEEDVERIVNVNQGQVLGYDLGGRLFDIDTDTGLGVPWADGVVEARLSPRRGYVVYRCDRGLFVVPLSP